MSITVNGESITDQEIEEEHNRLKPEYDLYVEDNDEDKDVDQLKEWSIENLIERTVLRQEAMKNGETIPTEELDKAYEDSKENFEGIEKAKAVKLIEHQIQIERLINKLQESVPEPTEQNLKEYYKANSELFLIPETIGARHIVKNLNQGEDKTAAYLSILNMKEEISKGKSFEELASENSDCPENAGDLGYFGRGQMVPEFEEVVFKLKIDEVSDVFLTDFGYHIAKVYDKKEPGPASFEEVKNHIAEHIYEEDKNTALEDYLDKLKADADIKK